MKSLLLPCCTLLALSTFADPPTAGTTRPDATQPVATRPNVARPATVKVVRGTLSLKFDSPAYFEAVDPLEVRLRFKQYAGELTILSIAPPAGTPLKKGDKLLEIDPVVLRRQLDAAENELLGAKANQDRLEAEFKLSEDSEALKLKNQQDAVHDAEDALKYWGAVDGPQMLKGWELQIQQSQHLVDDRNDELEQLRKMYKSEELTSATADIVVKRALRGLELAKVGLAMETERVEKDKATVYPASKRNVTDALTRARQALALYEVARTNLKTQWQTSLFNARAALTAANQKAEELRGDLEKLTVVALEDGVAWYGQLVNGTWQGGDAKALRPGEKVAAGSVLLTFTQPGKFRAVAELAEARYFSIPPATKVILTPVAFPNVRIQGTVDAAPRAGVLIQDRGVLYPARIETGDLDPKYIPGFKATAKFELAPAENVLVVPSAAISNGDVWVVGNDGAERKTAVVTGRVDGKLTEVVSGLSEGDQILEQPKGAN